MSEVLETALVKEVIAEADPELGAPPPTQAELDEARVPAGAA